MILKFVDVAHSTRVYPLSFRWPRPKHPAALSDVFVCPPTFALKSPSQLCNVFAFPGYYQWCCRSCLYLRLSEMSLAHILERSSVGICLVCVGLVMLLWISQRIILLCCLSISCLWGNLHLLVHCWPQSGTAGGHSGELWNFPLFFGLLGTLSRPISICFLSLHLPVLARVHLLVMLLHCMLQSSVILPLCGGSSWPIDS